MKTKYKQRIKEIIKISFSLLEQKMVNGSVISKNEASFQLELAYILKTIGKLYEFNEKEKFHLELENYITLDKISRKSGSNKARVDIYIEFGDHNEKVTCALELKFLKKENHREPNNRYDIFKDIANLEDYKENGIDLCYFYISTDHAHYVNQDSYSKDTADFDFRNNSKYIANTILEYKTEKPYGPLLQLNQSYDFKWKSKNDIHFMVLEV